MVWRRDRFGWFYWIFECIWYTVVLYGEKIFFEKLREFQVYVLKR